MSCKNPKPYNPLTDYGKIKYNPNWRLYIQNHYDDATVKEITALMESGSFSKDYGKQSLVQILDEYYHLSDDVDVSALKSRYATALGRSGKTGFTIMTKNFKKELIRRILIDPETYEMIMASDLAPSGHTKVNQYLYDFKMELAQSLWERLFNGKQFVPETKDVELSKLLVKVLSEYEKQYWFKPNELDDLWDTYFMLKYFDSLLVDFADFVKIKPEWQNGRKKGIDMYEYIGPFVKYDTSYNPDEFASAEQYTSAFTQTILDFFTIRNLDGSPSETPITFDGFNRAMCDLKEFILNSDDPTLRSKLYDGDNTDWDSLINAYVGIKTVGIDNKPQYNQDFFSKSGVNPETARILLGIKALLGKDSILDNKLKQVLQQLANRIVRYEFVGYRKGYDARLKKNVITEIRLKDSKIDKLKTSVARKLRYRVWKFRKNEDVYNKFKEDFKIKFNSDKRRFEFSDYVNGGRTLVLIPEKGDVYKFTWKFMHKNGNNESFQEVDPSEIKLDRLESLVKRLFQVYLPTNYNEVFALNSFGTKNLFDVFSNMIGLTFAASEGEFDFSFRLNDNELELPGVYFSSLDTPAKFIGITTGIQTETRSKNGVGNDLPNYQTISAIHLAQEMMDNAKTNKDGFRRTIHDRTGTVHQIWEDSVLDNKGGSPVLGRAMVRVDYDADGRNRNSADMTFSELNYFEIFKSYYYNLKRNGNILLQTTCLSDKHTHWLIEFKTSIAKLKAFPAVSIQSVLTNLTSGYKPIRDMAERQMMDEIKSRRASTTRIEILNLLNRYQKGLGLEQTSYEATFDEIKSAINALHEEFKKYSSVDEIYAKLKDAGVDYFVEADLINIGDRIWLNETLLHNAITYLSDDNSIWEARINRMKMLHAKNLFQSHFKIDATLDPGLFALINKYKSESEMGPEFNKWYDETSKLMKPFRIFDLEGNEVFPTYKQADIEKYFDSNNYRVQLNPVLLSHFYADNLFCKSFNDVVFGDDYGLECKYLKERNKQIKKLKNNRKIQQQINQTAQIKYDEAIGLGNSVEAERQKSLINSSNNRISEINLSISNLENIIDSDFNIDEDFMYEAEASRLAMHYKRTVHGGATFTPLNPNMPYGVSSKFKVAVVNDTVVPLYSIGGHREGFKSQDGAGHSSPYFSRMANNSYVDGRVGANKKTIFSYVDPETGILHLIKWAEYEITNSVRRDSPIDFEHASYEMMFKKMHSMNINSYVFRNFNIQNYYNTDEFDDSIHSSPIYFTSADGLHHYQIISITNNGNQFTRTIAEVDNKGTIIGEIESEPTVTVSSIYELDQLFGGAYVEEMQDDGRLDYSEVQNDLITRMICDLGLKEDFVAVSINASALKSGQRNNNASDIYVGDNLDELTYFEMSSRFGGAQMNADHILGESSVTEMSQMISALIQAGKRVKQVNSIYQFIGQVAVESLGDLVDISQDPDRELELYKWIGQALAKSFQTGTGDTLGLAGAFIAKANRLLTKNGLKTQIPLSANTVKGVFESSITSIINKLAIHRKFPGGGFVQMPTFDEKMLYTFGGQNYSYTELVKIISSDPKFINSGMSIHQVLNEYKGTEWITDPKTGKVRKVFKNPYIVPISEESRHELDQDDTVILYEEDAFGNIIDDSIEYKRLDLFEKWDEVRNFTTKKIAKWTVRPKNLLGPRVSMIVKTGDIERTFYLYDLDHARALQYLEMWIQGQSLSDDALNFLREYESVQLLNGFSYEIKADEKGNIKKIYDITTDEGRSRLKLWATRELNKTLSKLAKCSKDGSLFDAQIAFGTTDKVEIKNVQFHGSQVLIGRKDAEKFGIKNREDLQAIREDPIRFFRESLGYLRNKPERSSVPTYTYDGVLHDTDGNTVLLVVDEVNDGKILQGCRKNIQFTVDEDGNVFKDDVNLGFHNGVEFLTYTGLDGQEYTVLHATTMEDFNSFYKTTKLYSNWLPNANDNNWRQIAKYIDGVSISKEGAIFYEVKEKDGTTKYQYVRGASELNNRADLNVARELNILAHKRLASWNAYRRGIGTRIPAQSMQSFTLCEIAGFTDYETTGLHPNAKLMWIQGSDLDIDKLYFMMYGFTSDGMLATFSDLDDIMNAERVLDLPKPRGREFNIHVANNDAELQTFINDGATYITGNGFDLLQKILEQDNLYVVVKRDDLAKQKWADVMYDTKRKIDIQQFVDIHESSKRVGEIAQIALRNTVVRGIWNVLSDPVNQYYLELPISMDAARAAAKDSRAGRDELTLNSDVPSNKYKMQLANMVGRADIGIGASSLKAYFGASTYFNTNIQAALESLQSENYNPDDVWKYIKSCFFNSTFSDRGLITFANINYSDLREFLESFNEPVYITVSNLNDTLIKGVNDAVKNIPDVVSGNTVNLTKLVQYLDDASNGTWDNPIDAPSSLSEFISISTDNAKELILAKINATTKFADIYTYLLSVGESFKSIADFMTSPVFYIVADYAESSIMDVNQQFFDLENVIDFVLDNKALPLVDDKLWNAIITAFNIQDPSNSAFINRLLNDRTELGTLFREKLAETFGFTADDLKRNILVNVYNVLNTDEGKASMKTIIMDLLKREDAQNLLSTFIKQQVNARKASYDASNYNESDFDFDYDYDDQIDEEDIAHSYNVNIYEMSREEWERYYKYLHEYVIPKNQALSEVTSEDLKKLTTLKEGILPALKEQRMLAKILGINQGINTQDFDEYKWIRDIEAFINERYINGNVDGDADLEFNFMSFITDKAYRDKQIGYYEQVKSTYNILEIVSKSNHFWEMLKLAGINRKDISKSVAIKYERIIADKLLRVNKKIEGGLSRGLTQKLNDKEFRIIQNITRDLLTRSWFSHLSNLQLPIPQNKGIRLYSYGVLDKDPTTAKFISLAKTDDLASFKWIVENYIVDELKKLYPNNAFIQSLELTYSKNVAGDDIVEYLTLPFSLVNSTNSLELEQQVVEFKNGFNSIYKEDLANIGMPGWTIGDILYLYNLYVFKDGFGRDSLTRIFEDMINTDDNTLAEDYYNYLKELDSNIESVDIIDKIEQLTDESLSNAAKIPDVEARTFLEDLRIALATQPGASSKFRVTVVEENGKKVVQMQDKDYKKQAGWVNVPLKNTDKSDYKFALYSWNPPVLRRDTDIIRRHQQTKEKFSVNGKEAVRTAVRLLQSTFGENLPIRLIDTEFLNTTGRNWKVNPNAVGFIRNGTIYIIEDSQNIKTSTPVHELMHLVCAAMKYSEDANQRNAYYDLLRAVSGYGTQSDELNDYWRRYYEKIASRYEGIAVGSDLQEEVLVSALEDAFASGYYQFLSKRGSTYDENSQTKDTFKEFEDRVIYAINQVFKIHSSYDSKKVMNMTLGELLTRFSSSLIGVSHNRLLKIDVPVNQKLARFKRTLVQNANDEDKQDYLIINGDC